VSTFNIIAETNEQTVVSEYTPDANRSDAYQSEAELEREFIRLLQTNGYEYITICSKAELIANLRSQLELLNGFVFSDAEWTQLLDKCLIKANEEIVEKTRKIQDDYVQVLRRDDGTTKNVYLLDKKCIHNNRLQVINQYKEAGGNHETRYDVTILVNGLPLVHVELKRRGVAIREAFNQIRRYQRDAFWAGCGLFKYIQIFVISNGTHTKYYSNTTSNAHIKEQGESERKRSEKKSNSFEFTSFWADAKNRTIPDLVDFTRTFFAKYTILNILTKYCVFTSEDLLLVMRPYQIAATEQILSRIEIANNYKKYGTIDGGGYIWHTTGSGKTLTSFKAAQLATKMEGVDKVLFVVDRKDLDYQTMREYDRFQKGAANSNTSTAILKKQLEDANARIIITTIQKLDVFIGKNKAHDIYKKRVVIIFDECHRSQFGDMHVAITKAFKQYHLFGFTGTPIFATNAGSGDNPLLKTTEQAFGDKLHTYTIVNAINDGNVLPFRIDFVNTVKQKDNISDKDVRAIDIERAMSAPKRISEVVSYIIEHFDQKTQRNKYFEHSKVTNIEEVVTDRTKGIEEVREHTRINGFNSIFAVASIPVAKAYYTEFKKQLSEKKKKLCIATIFSYAPNEEEADEKPNAEGLDKPSREFLEFAISDYNKAFKTTYDTSSDKFQNYYKDLSMRVKNREVDLLIVVNMFLTGFDATTLNTLWVDKNLKHHSLIQAFSRTNRILNSVKAYGNIVCFRDLKQATDDAIALFGDRQAGGIVLLKSYNDYYNGYDDNGEHYAGYVELIDELRIDFPLGSPIIGEQAEKDFIKLYGLVLKLRNILSAFDDFAGNEILPERSLQDYQSLYIDLYQKYRKDGNADKENINDDIVFELELIKQIEVNIDYILMLVEKYHAGNCKDKTILSQINHAINASMQLRSKKELIENFVETVNVNTMVGKDWRKFVDECKEKELSELIFVENLKDEETRRFVENSFRDGSLKTIGTDIDKILPPVSRFGGGNRALKKQGIIAKLATFFEKYFGVG
jgi:type I restriction enzyme R subunit